MKNKKIIIFVFIFFCFMFLFIKINLLSYNETIINNAEKKKSVSLNLNGKSIAYVPLDDRPVNTKRIKLLADSLGYDLQLPSEEDYKTYLKNMGKNPTENHYGSPQAIAAWLDLMENNGCDYYIISMDQLFSGGLVGSRYLNDNDFKKYDNLYDDKYKYDNIKSIFEKIVNDSNNKVYLFDTIMRLASTVGSIDPQTNNYLELNDYDDLYSFGSINRQELQGNDLNINNIVNNYKKNANNEEIGSVRSCQINGAAGSCYVFNYNNSTKWLNNNLLNKYLQARERKIRLYDYYTNIIKNKSNVFLSVGIDDSSGSLNNIQKNEIRYVNKLMNNRIRIRDGADEQGMLMFSKLVLDKSNKSLNVNIKYFGGSKEKIIAYSNNSYEENISDLLEGIGVNQSSTNKDFDILIYIKPDDNNLIESASDSLLNEYKKNIINHVPTVIIDSQENNNNYLQNKLVETMPLGYLIGYSRWHMFSNSSGIAVSEGIVRYLYLISNDTGNNNLSNEGFVNTMMYSFLKDIGYISNVNSKTSSSNPNLSELILAQDMKEYENKIINNLVNESNFISDLKEYREKSIENISVSNYSFPWKRTFEISFNVNSSIREKSNYLIKYHSNISNDIIEIQVGKKGSNVNLLSDLFTNDGYIFSGWNTKADGSGTSYNNVLMLNAANDIDLYAQWVPNNYTITFYPNSGQGNMYSAIFQNGKTHELPKNIFSKTGYKFKNWNTKADGTGITYANSISITAKNNMQLYAQWQPITYKVIFDYNDGTNRTSEQTLTYDVGVKLNKNTITRNGYKFVCWNTQVNGNGTIYSDEQIVKNLNNIDQSTIRLYAIWEASNVEISKYIIDENRISGIDVNTTIDQFINNIEANSEYIVDVEYKTIKNQKVLYTGGKTKLYKDNVLEKEYINVVTGDIIGDGMSTSADLLQLRMHLLRKIELKDEHYIAANINKNTVGLDSSDLLGLRIILLNSSH